MNVGRRLLLVSCVATLLPADGLAITGIALKLMTSNVNNVVDIQSAGDGSGRLFLLCQSGQIRVLEGTNMLANAFLDISGQILFSGEQGLLGVAFDPGYATNGHFFCYFTHPTGNSNIVARFTAAPPGTNAVSAATRVDVISLTHTNQSNHNGGQIQFGPDGYLYIATGDGGGSCDPFGNAQNLGSPLGKLLRVNVASLPYTIPNGNPFAGAVPGLDEIWAYGLRNPWRFSFDRLTGGLFIADVGQGQREEVNLQPFGSNGGENYGWKCIEGTLANPCSTNCAAPGMVAPILEYTHAAPVEGNCSITGGYRYRGKEIPPLDAMYFYADYCSGRIWGATAGSNGTWSAAELTNVTFRITTFGEDETGELYLSDVSNGRVYRIVASDADADGLPDWWEETYFGSVTGGSAGTDADGDGLTNRQEFIAGTHPLNSSSTLRISSVECAGNDVVLRFGSTLNKRYRLQRTDDLLTGTWTTLTNNIIGTGEMLTLIDPGGGAQPSRFYRIWLDHVD